MRYRHIVFDIDGTLLDSAGADLAALQRVLRETVHREYDTADLQFVLGIPSDVALKRLGIVDTEGVIRLWNAYMLEYAHTMRLFDGIGEAIGGLKSDGVRLGIVTSKNRTEYRNDFSPFGLDGFFDTVICVEDSRAPKPSAEPMLAYLDKTGATPQEVLYIGDTGYDLLCARQAGVDFGLALWGGAANEHLAATYRFYFPDEIGVLNRE